MINIELFEAYLCKDDFGLSKKFRVVKSLQFKKTRRLGLLEAHNYFSFYNLLIHRDKLLL